MFFPEAIELIVPKTIQEWQLDGSFWFLNLPSCMPCGLLVSI
jgi:hypothetical protein